MVNGEVGIGLCYNRVVFLHNSEKFSKNVFFFHFFCVESRDMNWGSEGHLAIRAGCWLTLVTWVRKSFVNSKMRGKAVKRASQPKRKRIVRIRTPTNANARSKVKDTPSPSELEDADGYISYGDSPGELCSRCGTPKEYMSDDLYICYNPACLHPDVM